MDEDVIYERNVIYVRPLPSMRCHTRGVITGRRAAASPEYILQRPVFMVPGSSPRGAPE
jgi:hypothetical protein